MNLISVTSLPLKLAAPRIAPTWCGPEAYLNVDPAIGRIGPDYFASHYLTTGEKIVAVQPIGRTLNPLRYIVTVECGATRLLKPEDPVLEV